MQKVLQTSGQLTRGCRPGILSQAETVARHVSQARNALRMATQQELTPGSAVLSKALEQERNFDHLALRYATDDPFDTMKGVAAASGRSNKAMSGLVSVIKVAAPIGVAAGVGTGIYEVVTAPEGEKGRVASREAGGFVGGAVLSDVGVGVGASGGVALAGFLGLSSGPVGWLALGLAGLGGATFGYGGSELGRFLGQGAYNAATAPPPTGTTPGHYPYYRLPR